jgi:hypothetical protein
VGTMNRKKKLPDFLIVGAAKSGTTSLFNCLKQHPQVFMPSASDEPYFLTGRDFKEIDHKKGAYGKNVVTTLEDYANLFKNAKGHKAIGEKSVGYLYYYEESIKNIKKYLNNPKIIIILRNPVERAFSNYLHHVRDLYEKESFESALDLIQERKQKNYWWGYDLIGGGLYYHPVKSYLEDFNDIKILLHEDLKNNKENILKDIFEFLGVDSTFKVDTDVYSNISGVPKNYLLQHLLFNDYINPLIKYIAKKLKLEKTMMRLRSDIVLKNIEKPKMKKETREYLTKIYKDDILKTQELINRDVSGWLK